MNGIISKDLKQGLSRRWEWIESEEKGLDFGRTRYSLDTEPSQVQGQIMQQGAIAREIESKTDYLLTRPCAHASRLTPQLLTINQLPPVIDQHQLFQGNVLERVSYALVTSVFSQY